VDVRSESFRGAPHVDAGGAALDAPVDLVDVSEEQQRAGTEVLEAVGDLLLRAAVARLEGQDDLGLACGAGRRRHHLRLDVVLDGEVLVARVNLGAVRERVDRLEADAEAADGVLVLRALRDAADAAHVSLVERPPEVRELQPAGRQREGDAPRSARVAASTERVLGVLEQLEDEVRAVVVAVGEQHRPDAADVGAVARSVLVADGSVVRGRHHRPSARSPSISSMLPRPMA
jgi:hypothetical protein